MGQTSTSSPPTNICWQSDLDQCPETRQELKDMELFYTREQNFPRKGVAGSYETSAPVVYLLDHLQALLKETRCVSYGLV